MHVLDKRREREKREGGWGVNEKEGERKISNRKG